MVCKVNVILALPVLDFLHHVDADGKILVEDIVKLGIRADDINAEEDANADDRV